ncbi:MAG TPA: SprB repeat-containing protein, partial [Chryseosolibacter sp.]
MERASGTVTFSGQSVGFVDQIAPFVVVVKGTGATNGDVQISLNGTANGPYDQRAPASVPISGNYSGNHNNFNCVATNFSANNLNNEFNGSITLFPQTSISTPDYSASCTNLGSTFTATSCSTLQWSISTNSAGPYQPIPGQTGASLTLTRAMVTGMGFSNLITTFYVKATGRDQTTSDFRQATLYYPPPQFSANAISPTCSNGTGSVQVTITPSTPVITDFVVSHLTDPVGPGTDATTSLTLHQFNGLGGGQYYVMVRNNTNTAVYGNCSTDRQLVGTVTIPPPVNVSLTPTNATCYGYANGSIQATIQNAVGSVGFSWTGAGSGANIRTNLSAGNYSLTVTDSRGCTGNNNATVGQPTPVVADATSPAPYGGFNVRCAGESNGSLNASASGGSGGFTYYWSTGHTGPNVPNVGTGLYSVTAVDANGCQANDNVQLSAPPPIDFSIGIDNAVTCPGTSTGSLSPQNIANAVGLLAYSWSTGETTSAINSKPAGQYSLTITDGGGSGCSATRQQTLVDPQPFTVQISPQSNFHGSYISCDGGADGALNAAVTDLSGSAVAAQNYQWYRNNIFYAGGPGLNTLNLLDAATYRVEATYGSGCITQASYVLNDPQPVSAQISATSNHHGFAISCPGASDGTLLATGSDGTPGGYTFQWYNGPATASISGVPAGTYFVNVTDINGCEGSANYVLNDPLPMLPTIDITSNYHGQAISCANASDAILTASAMNGAAPVQFSWSNGLQGNVVNNISAGSYTVTAEDANGCEVVSQPLVVTNPNPVSASIAIVSDYNGQAIQCHNGNNGILTVSGSGGTNNYSYLWNTGATTMQANGLSSGTYSVIVRDQNNCEDSDEEELINPSQVVASIKSHSNYNGFGVSCHGSENGAIEVEAVGGTDDFTFSWPALAQTTAAVENLTPGTYQVIVTDLNGCTDELSYEVTEPDLLSTQLSMATDISCFAGSDGV